MKNNIFQNKNFAIFAAIFCTLLWGTAFPFIKLGYEEFQIADGDIGSKLLFAGFRFMLAGLMVFAILCIGERKFALPQKGDLAAITLLGLVQTGGQYLFTYIGIGFTSGTNTSIITACAAFITVLAVPIFFKSDRLTVLKILGCVLGFGGVLAINQGGGVTADTLFGDAMILLSTVCAASGNIISKKVAGGRNPVLVTAFQLAIGAAALIVAGFVCGGRLSFSNIKAVAILLWLALVSAVSFSIWTALLKYHPASKITVFNLLVPIFGTVLSGFLLGENVFRIETLLSLVMISAGIVLVNISKERKRMIKGVIFDMDGVVLDSEKLYVRFWCEAANFCGYPMQSEHALGIRSMARPLAKEKLKGWFGEDFDYEAVHAKRVELMDAFIDENGIEPKPYAEELLSYLKENGYRVALATATPKDRAEDYLARVGLLKYFDEVVSARMVEHGKPAPDIYIYAAEKIGLAPCECLALEDSPNGIKSASSAGCKTVMVPDLDGPTDEIAPLLYAVANGLNEVIKLLK